MPTQKQFLDSVGLTELLDELGQYLKTTIPTVNNATLTIQKNGTNVATFTANASTGATANITVPTATSDLTNDSGFLGDADVSYDANSKTLIIGGGSMNTYTITLSGAAVSSITNILVDGVSHTYNDFPLNINEGKTISFDKPVGVGIHVTMDGVDITYSSNVTNNPTNASVANITGDINITLDGSGGGLGA